MMLAPARNPETETIHVQINDRCCVECESLAYDQSSNDSDPKRPAQLITHAGAKRKRKSAEKCRKRRHENWTEAQKRGLKDCFLWRLSFSAFRFECEINHHNRVLFDNPD